MANISLNHTAGSAVADRAGSFLSTLRRRIADYRMYRRTYWELEQLSNDELRDLGLGRGDLHRVARESVYGA